jgi:predicted RNA-binding protein YlqC (UPF0109 family)
MLQYIAILSDGTRIKIPRDKSREEGEILSKHGRKALALRTMRTNAWKEAKAFDENVSIIKIMYPNGEIIE